MHILDLKLPLGLPQLETPYTHLCMCKHTTLTHSLGKMHMAAAVVLGWRKTVSTEWQNNCSSLLQMLSDSVKFQR